MVFLDSIAHINETHHGVIVISGSHGGISAAKFVVELQNKPCCVFFNDAGDGKENAGTIAIKILESHHIACICYGHKSARIGDAVDGYENGLITRVNQQAIDKEIQLHMSVKLAVLKLMQ